MKVIIPMSGKGARFLEAGYKVPKPLIEVDGKPMIAHVLDLFPGETDVHCICSASHIETTNMRQILEGYGATVHVIDDHKLGPVYAVSKIFDAISDDEEVVVSYCDYGTVWDYAAFKSTVRNTGADGAIAVYRGFHPHMLGTDNYAFLKCDATNRLVEIREKEPFTADRMSEYASNGTYYFRTGAILKKYFQEALLTGLMKNGEFYVSLVYNLLVRDGLVVIPFEIQKMLQWGTPKDLEVYTMWSRHFKQSVSAPTEWKSNATLILPMAGRGSRFKLTGFDTPKPMLDVNGAPMVIRAVQCLPACEQKVFVCLKEHLAEYDLHGLLSEFKNADVYAIETVTEGQACTCEIALDNAQIKDDTPILISACDNGVDYDSARYGALESDPDVDVIVWSFNNNPTSKLFPHMYAWLDVDGDDVKHVSVKKYFEGASHAIIGTMYFRKAAIFREGLAAIYEENIRTNGEYYVDDLLNPLIKRGYKVKVFPVDAYICWGTPADYKTYNYWLEHFSAKYGKPCVM
jgi:NDP-sugar pyrophosphorylase family protein